MISKILKFFEKPGVLHCKECYLYDSENDKCEYLKNRICKNRHAWGGANSIWKCDECEYIQTPQQKNPKSKCKDWVASPDSVSNFKAQQEIFLEIAIFNTEKRVCTLRRQSLFANCCLVVICLALTILIFKMR